jgi:hypothetical protein
LVWVCKFASELLRDTTREVGVLSVTNCGMMVKIVVWRKICERKFR